MLKWNFLYFNFCSFLLSLSLDITKKSLDPSSYQVFINIVKDPSEPSLLQCKQSQLSQPLLKGELLQPLMISAILQSYGKPYNFHITQRMMWNSHLANLLEFNVNWKHTKFSFLLNKHPVHQNNIMPYL